MNSSQMFAIFIIGFMAFSTLAFVLSAAFQSPEQPGPSNGASNQPASRVTYLASVDANVLEVFPSFKLFAKAKEFDIAKIDSALAQTEGVSSVRSVFRQSQDGSFYYVADVSFDAKKTDLESLTALIEERFSGFFEGPGFFPNALIVVPQKLLLENADLNLSKQFELTDNIIQSYLNPGTIKGDEILARVEMVFAGEQQISTSAFEVSNFSSETKQGSVLLSPPLASLEPRLAFSADASYSDSIDENTIKEQLLKTTDVNSVDLSFEPPSKELLLTINNPADANSLELDLNAALLAIANVSSVDLLPGENDFNAIISFTENADFNQLKQDVSKKLLELNVREQDFFLTESSVMVSGEIELKTTEAKPAADGIAAFFSSKKFNARIYQLGTVKLESVTDKESNKTLTIDSNSVEALLFAGHKIGDTVFASVLFEYQRSQLLGIRAIEIINPVRIG